MPSPLFTAAAHLVTEIHMARKHLVRLEGALNGMQPLLTEAEHTDIEELLSLTEGVKRLPGANVVDMEVKPAAPAASATAAHVEEVTPEVPAARATASDDSEVAAAVAATGRSTKARKTTKGKAVRRAGRPSRTGAPTLPSTGGGFWLGLMGKRRHTLTELVDKAITNLEVPEEARVTLHNRLNSWLYPAVKAGTLVAAGEKDGLKTFKVA